MIENKMTVQSRFATLFACLLATTLVSTSCGLSTVGSNKQKIQPLLKKVPIEISLKKHLLIETETGEKKLIGYESIVLEPSLIGIELYSGWNRESEANKDKNALAFISGPTFELRPDSSPHGYTAHGDIKGENGLFLSKNKAAAAERGFISVDNKGQPNFGYGKLTDAVSNDTRLFTETCQPTVELLWGLIVLFSPLCIGTQSCFQSSFESWRSCQSLSLRVYCCICLR